MRTNLDIDDPILKDLRDPPSPPPFRWLAKPMRARVDLADKHALLDALDDAGR
jgi:hypothetical protein